MDTGGSCCLDRLIQTNATLLVKIKHAFSIVDKVNSTVQKVVININFISYFSVPAECRVRFRVECLLAKRTKRLLIFYAVRKNHAVLKKI